MSKPDHVEAKAKGRRTKLWSCVSALGLVLLYLALWPVPISPASWQAPKSPGYTGVFLANKKLAGLEPFPLASYHGPEDLAVDSHGMIYASCQEGAILSFNPKDKKIEVWVNTGGRPLGIEFDNDGNLIVADVFRGLLSIAPDKTITELVTSADGIPIRFADGVDIAKDKKIYFSDASTKFAPGDFGGVLEASFVDIVEHGAHGRLLVYDPETKKCQTLLKDLHFANGVAISPDQQFLLVIETSNYRVVKYWIAGPKKGVSEVMIDELPGFPDNISAGLDGRFWIGMIAPRDALIDSCADKPWARRIMLRLPEFLKPKPVHYGHVIAIDSTGRVLVNLQDPAGQLAKTTGVLETRDHLYISSLDASFFGRMKSSRSGY
jgi:sugar lactone lactonase YvrE